MIFRRLSIVLVLSIGLWECSDRWAAEIPSPGKTLQADGIHVFPGQEIQAAVEAASQNPTNKVVRVHAGEYRPKSKGQALVWFNRRHEGVRLIAVGKVTLTAANPEVATPGSDSYPAVVNHVVYFGDGISSNTMIEGFRLTGANHFVTDKLTQRLEPDNTVPKNLFFLTDGGAVKVFGRSSPTLRNLVIEDNYTSPCGAGISVQQQGFSTHPVSIEDCVFRNNRAQVTGAAVDLLEGSAARLVNCLFVGNASNMGKDTVALRAGEEPFTNCGVLTIFKASRAWVERCTFTGNRNAVDDMGGESTYLNCIFYRNNLEQGLPNTPRYELDLAKGAKVSGCWISDPSKDPKQAIASPANTLEAPDPQFTKDFVPQNPAYQDAGFRPR